MPSLEDAIQLALEAHRGRKDRYGQPYILHVLRVMHQMPDDDTRLVALMHDVIEDSAYTLSDLRHAGYPPRVIAGVDAMTRREDESYEEYIERLVLDPLARRVKAADLEDNMDLRRVVEFAEEDYERMKRYRRAWARVTGQSTD